MNGLGFVERFERRLERLVNGAFSKAFKSQIQPVEISSAIKAKMDAAAAVVNKDRILAPNAFKVRLGLADYSRLSQLGPSLQGEIQKQVTAHAKKQRYQFPAPLEIVIESSSTLGLGQIQVSASGSKPLDVEAITWQPVLEINGKQINLTLPKTTIGRDAAADIQIDDAGLSRTHFAISWNGSQAKIEDLNSTNGTKIAGVKIKSQDLAADTVINAGRSEFIFRVVATGGN